jgi:UDP-glucose 4-epimerase
MNQISILVTGGAGYIGSHACLELSLSGYEIVVVDNLCNSSQQSIKRVEKILNKKIPFYNLDLRDKKALKSIFRKYSIGQVFHFAGLKAVGESIEKPIEYYDNNIIGTLALLEVMQEFGSKTIVFSSSATVYGNPKTIPVSEDSALSAINPYGRSKLLIEKILEDIFVSDESWRIAILRYFNPIGAHKSGLIGESPKTLPNNLIPYVSQVALGKVDKLRIFGSDYDTPDGSGVRDYIHVMDLVKGHIKALQALEKGPQLLTINLGTGKGYSVFDIVKAYEKISGRKVPYEIVARRNGDVASCYSDPSYAAKKLRWKAFYGIEDMCMDDWNWRLNNPDGYL